MTRLTKYYARDIYNEAGIHGADRVYLADDVEAVLGECEEVLEVLVNLIPDIGKLSKVQALVDRLKG